MRVQAHLIAVMPSTTAQTPLGVKGLSSATAMFPSTRRSCWGAPELHPQRRKGALGQDLADADRRVEFRLGMLPVNPGEHLLRAEELDRRELPLLAADKYAVVGGDQPGPMREVLRRPIGRQRRQPVVDPAPGAETRTTSAGRMAWATGASSADTWSFLPFARKPSAKGWNTFLSTSSQVSATNARVAVRCRDRASRYSSMSGPAPAA